VHGHEVQRRLDVPNYNVVRPEAVNAVELKLQSFDVLKGAVKKSLKERNGYLKPDDSYQTYYAMEQSQVQLAALLMVARSAGISVEKAHGEVKIFPMNKHYNIEGMLKTAKTFYNPVNFIVHDDNHFVTLIVDKDAQGAYIASGFNGHGEFGDTEFQQRIMAALGKNHIDFVDRSAEVQVDKACGLTTACMIADYTNERARYLANPFDKSSSDFLSGIGKEDLRGQYEDLGKDLFANMEIVTGVENKIMHKAIQAGQIAKDETLAWKLALQFHNEDKSNQPITINIVEEPKLTSQQKDIIRTHQEKLLISNNANKTNKAMSK
jgi:hypothetical protein